MIEITELVKRKKKNIVWTFANSSNFLQHFCRSAYGKNDIINISDFEAQNGYIYDFMGALHKYNKILHLKHLKTQKFSIYKQIIVIN